LKTYGFQTFLLLYRGKPRGIKLKLTMTKYEKTRILGQRAKQINDGAMPFIKVPEGVIDGYLIALKELEEKKIPFIIKRTIPGGCVEYWKVSDLENNTF
jgi:DNA-directed RNA polymerase I, II, and III subunit RPABC2